MLIRILPRISLAPCYNEMVIFFGSMLFSSIVAPVQLLRSELNYFVLTSLRLSLLQSLHAVLSSPLMNDGFLYRDASMELPSGLLAGTMIPALPRTTPLMATLFVSSWFPLPLTMNPTFVELCFCVLSCDTHSHCTRKLMVKRMCAEGYGTWNVGENDPFSHYFRASEMAPN